MRKNLLLLIMFCLIATIGAKATATATPNGTTLTITTENAGEMGTYLNAVGDNAYTSLVVKGPMSIEDMKALAKLPKLTSIDLSLATGLTTNDIMFTGGGTKNLNNVFANTLQTIKFPKVGPTEIPANCMDGYKALVNIIIPTGYTKIGENAFNPELNETTLGTLKKIYIPEGIISIGKAAFANSAIQSVRLPNSLLTIGERAFVNCDCLTSITIPANVTNIYSQAFNNCHNLKDVYVVETDKNNVTIPNLNGNSPFSLLGLFGSGGGYPQNVTENTTVNREDYWNDRGHICLLHYPVGFGEYFTGTTKEKNYSLFSNETEGNVIMDKYPTETQGKNYYDLMTNPYKNSDGNSWKQFVLSTTYTVTPAPNLADSRWYTICFKFNMTKEQIESAFGVGTEVCRFKGVKKEYINNDLTATLDFTYDLLPDDSKGATDVITLAGHPYMIHPAIGKPASGAMVYYISGIKDDPNCKAPTPDDGEVFDESSQVAGYYSKGSYQFIGTFETDAKVPVGNYFLSRDKTGYDLTEDGHRAFYYNSKKTDLTWPKYTATLYEVKGTINHTAISGQNAKTGIALGSDAVIFTSDNSTTGIEDIESDNNETSVKFADKVFSISGQLVRTGSSSLEGLAKGIYIVNGKKYIVR